MAGLTLDSGALIAFERADREVMRHLKEAQQLGMDLTVPTAVVVEVWRGGSRSAQLARLLAACVIEPLSDHLARIAGEAIGKVRGASVVDAVVMSSAAERGDRVLTCDPIDLGRLRRWFPRVRLIAI